MTVKPSLRGIIEAFILSHSCHSAMSAKSGNVFWLTSGAITNLAEDIERYLMTRNSEPTDSRYTGL